MSTINPFAAPLYVMLKPAGSICNLRCRYCYYLDKKALYPDVSDFMMSESLLERFIEQYLRAQTQPYVNFTWHGGEPLLRGIAFYRRAIALQKQYGARFHIENCLQTNGVLLNDEWCRFFKDNHFLIGISIDGTAHCHNRYRVMPNGNPTFDRVMRGIEYLKKREVEYNAMAVVNNYNADYPVEFYRFFKSIDCRYIQFSPIVETVNGQPAAWNVSARQWGNFLIKIFDEWIKRDVGAWFVQMFDATLANWVGEKPGICTLAPTCGHAGVMEFNGDVYSCDHFVYPSRKLGNIYSQTLVEMMYSGQQSTFGADKYNTLPASCKACKYLFACNGECPKNRITETGSKERLNYLCKGYYRFFEHAAPYMEQMKQDYLQHLQSLK
jgi:uncharacterized protein